MSDLADKESPWIHPAAVAALLRGGLVEAKDVPAMVRLYVRSQVEWHQRAGRDYWEGNGKIARTLGVPLHQVENAIRRSITISRENKGKGRRESKRFLVAEAARSADGDSQIDGCHQSDRRVETVKMTGDTSQIGGCHRNRRFRKEEKGCEEEGREEQAEPACLPVQVHSLISEKESMEILKGYHLLDPQGLSQAFYDLLSRSTGAPLNATEDDIGYAARCLRSLPDEFRRPEVLSAWLVWYCRTRPRKRDKSWWLTSFAGSWGAYRPIAQAEAAATEKAETRRRRAACRRQQKKEEKRRQALHEAFVAGLPTEESVIAAIEAVPAPPTFGYNDSVHWVGELLGAPGLDLHHESTTWEYDYIMAAYQVVEFNPQRMILETKKFAVNVAIETLEELRGDICRHGLEPKTIRWRRFCDHFGFDTAWPGRTVIDVPENAVDYRNEHLAEPDGGTDIPV